MTSALVDPSPVTVRVPAKVNLGLFVGPLRDDGYHSLATVYQAVNLYDDVTVAVADEWGVSVTGPLARGVPNDGSNLALKAARLLAMRSGIRQPVHITIHKDIPVAGGMAGGSADAAATLVACDQLWGLELAKEELELIAAELGSDVPFLIAGGTAIGRGRGELLAPVLSKGTLHWVFALSEGGLSTPAVYRTLDERRAGRTVHEPVVHAELIQALRRCDPHELAPLLVNDLQEAAIAMMPRLGELLADGLEYGALAGVVSGSGPTVAFLVESHEAGIDLAVALTASGSGGDVRRATGPVHGAHVLPVRAI